MNIFKINFNKKNKLKLNFHKIFKGLRDNSALELLHPPYKKRQFNLEDQTSEWPYNGPGFVVELKETGKNEKPIIF